MMGLALVVTHRVRPGHEQAFDALVQRTVESIRTMEPGTLVYGDSRQFRRCTTADLLRAVSRPSRVRRRTSSTPTCEHSWPIAWLTLNRWKSSFSKS